MSHHSALEIFMLIFSSLSLCCTVLIKRTEMAAVFFRDEISMPSNIASNKESFVFLQYKHIESCLLWRHCIMCVQHFVQPDRRFTVYCHWLYVLSELFCVYCSGPHLSHSAKIWNMVVVCFFCLDENETVTGTQEQEFKTRLL